MKKWNKIKYPLFIALIAVPLSFIRFLAIARPSWVNASLIYPLWVVCVWLTEPGAAILLFAVGAGAAMLVPCEGERAKLRRFLLRPLLTMLAIVMVSSVLVPVNDGLETKLWQERVKASHKEIQKFVEMADEAILYSYDDHLSQEKLKDFQALAVDGMYVTDTMMIDYDTMTIGFAYQDNFIFTLRTFSFEKGQLPQGSTWSHSVDLDTPGATLTLYFDYRDGAKGNGSTMTCIALTMADGTVYIAADITDPETGYYYFVGHPDGGEYRRIEDFLQRKQ